MNHQPNTPASRNEAVGERIVIGYTWTQFNGKHRSVGACPTEHAYNIEPIYYPLAATGAAIDAREQEAINTARLAWLHTANKDAEGYEYGVCKVKYDEAGKLVSCLWTAGDSSDVDAAMSAACRPSKEWYAAKIAETLDDDFAIGKAALASRQEAPPASEPFQKALEIRIAQGFRLGGNACPVLYTDSINGEQVGRDDLWIATTAGLKGSDGPTPSEALSPATVAQPVTLTDAELGAAAYKGFDDYWTEDSPGRERDAWTASAKAVLKAAQPCASQGCGDAEIDCAVDVYSSRMCERGTKGCAARHAALSKK